MGFDTSPEPVPPELPPAHMQQVRTLRQAVAMGLVAFSLLLLFLAAFLITTSVRNDINRSEANLATVQERLFRLRTPSPERQELLTTLTNTQSLANRLTAARPPGGIQWPAVVTVLSNYNAGALTLTSLTQVENRITLMGQAVDDVVVVEYARMLDTSDLFSTVVLQSLALIPPPPPAAGATPTPLAPAAERVEFVIILELSGSRS
ncbi:MAG: PilN domain-containing protein [Caldilineaceae bacterium]